VGNYQCFVFGKILHIGEKKYLGKSNKGLLGKFLLKICHILRKKLEVTVFK
jgi:hypothetical protein